MKHEIELRKERGFSLVEMLVVIAVIGIIAAIAEPSIGAINDKANTARDKRNAQNAAALYNGARSVGVIFNSGDKGGILGELIEGRSGIEVAGSNFKMSEMSAIQRNGALAYLAYDSDSAIMSYDPTGGQVVGGSSIWWGNWNPSGDSEWFQHDLITEGNGAAKAAELKAAFPEYNFSYQYDSYILSEVDS